MYINILLTWYHTGRGGCWHSQRNSHTIAAVLSTTTAPTAATETKTAIQTTAIRDTFKHFEQVLSKM